MTVPALGRLERVDLRQAWSSESEQFTPWLAQEKEVGPFRADILCKDTANDSWVLIENQLLSVCIAEPSETPTM